MRAFLKTCKFVTTFGFSLLLFSWKFSNSPQLQFQGKEYLINTERENSEFKDGLLVFSKQGIRNLSEFGNVFLKYCSFEV